MVEWIIIERISTCNKRKCRIKFFNLKIEFEQVSYQNITVNDDEFWNSISRKQSYLITNFILHFSLIFARRIFCRLFAYMYHTFICVWWSLIQKYPDLYASDIFSDLISSKTKDRILSFYVESPSSRLSHVESKIFVSRNN